MSLRLDRSAREIKAWVDRGDQATAAEQLHRAADIRRAIETIQRCHENHGKLAVHLEKIDEVLKTIKPVHDENLFGAHS